MGVQFRNCATVGGSVFGRFGFSDVLTLLLALDARVVLQGAGELSLEEFCARPPFRDILVRVIVPKGAEGTVYLSQRNSATDFPVLTCAIARREGAFRFAIGARPGRARVYLDEKGLLSGRITRGTAPWPWGRICPAGSPWGTTCVPGRSTGQRSARPWCAGAC